MLFACTLLIAAAADLAPLERTLARAVSGCTITFSFGSSGMLSRQIEHGAEFDLFLSAGKTYTDGLVARGHADSASHRTYAYGRLGFWSPKSLKWQDLANWKSGRIAMANPAHAPYGLAAKQALERRGLWPKLQSNLVFGENVRQAWQFAESGNADAVITSWTLLHDKGGELLHASWHEPVVQAAVIPTRAKNRAAAQRFLDWLLSSAGQQVLKNAGLDPAVR